MNTDITLRAKSPLYVRAGRVDAGKTFSCGALEAHDALASGRCELVNPGDVAQIREAVERADARHCPPRGSVPIARKTRRT